MPKISDLPAGATGTGAETYPAVQSGTTVKLTAGRVAESLVAGNLLRERLSASRTYYVNPSSTLTAACYSGLTLQPGSDSASGLTIATPFLTLQHAWNVVAYGLDLAGQTLIIQLGDGTYTGAAGSILVAGDGPLGVLPEATNLLIRGNLTTRTNVVIAGSGTGPALEFGDSAVGVILSGMKVTNSNGDGVLAAGSAYLEIGAAMEFGACTSGVQIIGRHGAFIISTSDYNVSGGGNSHASAETQAIVALHTTTVTFSNAPAYAVSTYYCLGGQLHVGPSTTFTNGNTVTGKRFTVFPASFLYHFGNASGAQYLPGNAAGVVFDGGAYGTFTHTFMGDAAYTVTGIESVIEVIVALTAPRTINLWPANKFWPGQRLLIVDGSGTVGAVNKVTATPSGADLINGVNGVTDMVTSAYGKAELMSDGFFWTKIR